MKCAIVGGGPIGLFTAYQLAKQGHQVDLFESGTWPRDKTCGQGIMPSGISLLEKSGIQFNLPKEAHSFQGIHYQDGKRILQGFFPRSGFGVERKVLSQKLFDLVSKEKSIQLFENQIVHRDEISLTSEKVLLKENQYDYLFACDGLNSPLRKLLENEKVRPGVHRMGAREHFHQAPWSSFVEVYWSDGCEAYVTPVSESKVEIAFLWYENLFCDQKDLREKLFQRFPDLMKKVDLTKSQDDFRGYGPFKKVSRKEKIGRVFFVGDAYQFLDGITGEGISLGLKASQLIAKNFITWNLLHHIRLRFYYLHYTLMVNVALSLSHNKTWRRFLFHFFQYVPKGFNTLLRLNDL